MGVIKIGEGMKPTRVQELVMNLPSDQEGQVAAIQKLVDDIAPNLEADIAAARSEAEARKDAAVQAATLAGQSAAEGAIADAAERYSKLERDRDAIREENTALRARIAQLETAQAGAPNPTPQQG